VIQNPAFRYHGGKFRLAQWVIGHFPRHKVYVEPFGGAAGVLLQKEPSYAEVYNDIDGDVVNFFRVLQVPEQCARLVELLALTPYARSEFDRAWEPTECAIERARRLLIRSQMGFGSAGATKGRTGFRIDTQRRYGTAQGIWARYPETMAALAQRFSGVLIENRPATRVMVDHDAVDTLHYVDPPYVHSTRSRPRSSGKYYRYEMDDAQHLELMACLNALEGQVVVSGYRCELYDEHLRDWERFDTRSRISANRGAGVRVESLWLNPAAFAGIRNVQLFESA
jgi:DNA adenine methylase